MREDIKERIELIKNGDVPEGYKKTKLGIVPKEWDIFLVKDILERVDNPVEINNEQEYIQIGIRSHGKGIFYKEPVTGQALGNKAVFWVEPDCFIVNIVFAWEQAIARTTGKEIGYIASHRFPMYKPIGEKASIDYLVQYFLTKKGKDVMEMASPGGAGRNRTLGQERFMKSKIICPAINEQQKLAEIFETQNKLILKLEKNIELLKSRKKWLMQNLLTGKKRLSGYEDKWREVKIKKYLQEINERNKEKQISSVKSVSNKRGFINQREQFDKTVASNDVSNYKIVRKGYIAYNPSRINVGSVALYNEDSPGIVSPMYVVFNTSDELNEEYFMYYMGTNVFYQSVKKLLSGSVRESLKFDDLCSMKIKIPSYEEQKSIVKVLQTADKEIELLEKKLELIKKEKKAMMQLLLTGIVRVDGK